MKRLADVAVKRHGRWMVAVVAGEVDLTNAETVGEELIAAVPNDARGLVADLGGTSYVDSAAIELLFELSRRLRRRRQELRLVVPASSPLTRVLQLTEMTAAAPVHGTLAAALDDG